MSTSLIKPETPKTIAEMQSLGEVFVRSKFFADSTDAAQAIVKVMAGAELGFPPIASMTGVYIVKGKVSLSANLIAAAIKRSGRYTYRVLKLDDSGCEIAFYEGGTEIGSSSFTREDAQRAQLLGKETWRSFFRNMAFARALSNGAKWHCPDVFGGPVYTPEELGANVDGDGEVINVTPEPETKRPLALVPAAQPVETIEQKRERLEAEVHQEVQELQKSVDKLTGNISDPLPDTPNTQPADDEEAARIEQEHSNLNIWIKAAWKQAGGDDAQFEVWVREKDLYNWTIGRKRSALEKLNEKAKKLQEEKKSEPKSNEPASGYAGQREDGARKVLRKGEDGKLEAQWEKSVDAEPKKSRLKTVIDEVIAEHWPNTPDGYNEGYKAARAFVVSIIGEFKNFDEINKADEAKAIAALSRWNPADEGKGKK